MMNRHWALPLAFASGIAFGTALMLRRRREQRDFQRALDKQEIHKWEDEGGNLAPPRMRRAT
jgi:hypothetical protein